MAKLTPESPRLFRPTLAAWIGLNESIFLEQLNFILTEVENKGKFADGKKWYRDTPRAFMIQYFPFWDESIVKRTIANLRADALILARSDLNDDPKDRSLWYTINYPTLERLDRPVARITGKVAKRKEARQARKTGQDSNIEYTKVQNVLLPEVQSVPRVQNVPTPQVQNVPTPKDSSFIESKHLKESERETHAHKLKRIGEVDYLNQNRLFAVKLSEICGNPGPEYVVKDDRKKLAEATAQLLDWDATTEQLTDFRQKWKFDDDPWLSQIVGQWGRYLSSKQPGRNGASRLVNKSSPPLSAEKQEALKQHQTQDAKEIHVPGS